MYGCVADGFIPRCERFLFCFYTVKAKFLIIFHKNYSNRMLVIRFFVCVCEYNPFFVSVRLAVGFKKLITCGQVHETKRL